jgi:hypothetical protein
LHAPVFYLEALVARSGRLALSDASESILGVIPVTFPRRIGFEHMRLYVTSTRIIVAHKSRKGLASLALAPLLGRYSGSTDDSVKELGRRGKAKVEAKSPEEILADHKDNFALGYDELVGVELRENSGVTNITILTREDKFQLSSDIDLKEITGLLSPNLGAKLRT